MKNKRKLKVMILAALAATVTLVCSGCQAYKPEYTGRLKVFKVGEHAIAIPYNGDPDNKPIQVPVQPGYEVIGISSSDHVSKYVILYKNVEDVECTETEDGYTLFGIPVEKEQTRKLTQEE